MKRRIVRWGNGYGVRLRKDDLRALSVHEGSIVELQIRPAPSGEKADLSDLPTFRDSDPKASVHHDRYLYGGRK